MNTIAIKNKSYTKASRKKMSLKERFVKYYRENQADIVAGCMLMGGNTSAVNVYRMINR